MGVITLALIAYGSWTDVGSIPLWVKVVCALAIASGTYVGGWRVIRTLGKGLVEISSPQGMAAEAASAAVILSSSHLGMALSTTHVATGSILGSGVGRPGAQVRWGVAGRMVIAWVITLPAAAVVGAALLGARPRGRWRRRHRRWCSRSWSPRAALMFRRSRKTRSTRTTSTRSGPAASPPPTRPPRAKTPARV